MKNLLLAWGLLWSFAVFSQSLRFQLDGKDYKTLSRTELAQVREEREAWNVFRGYRRTYVGRDFFALMDKVYGPSWRSKKKIEFFALDGYRQTSLVPGLLAQTKHRGLLALSEKGRKGFTPIEKGGKTIDPGPFWLVWEGYQEGDTGSHGDNLKWPYQLGRINLAD